MTIDWKIRLNKWYLFVLILISLLVIIASIIFILDKYEDKLATVLLLVFSSFGFALMIYLHLTYKSIRLKNNGIQLKKRFYKWTDFQSVCFQPKRNLVISFEFQLDRGSVLFETKDNKKHIFTLNYYKDYNILKFLALHFDQLKYGDNILVNYLNTLDTDKEEVDLHKEEFENYYPNPIKISYLGIVSLGLILAYFFYNYSTIFLFTFLVILIFISGFNYHYFKVSDNYLVIKNIIYFWKKIIFKLEDIHSVNYGAPGAGALVSGLKISTKDLKQHFFASGLSNKAKINILIKINKNNKA